MTWLLAVWAALLPSAIAELRVKRVKPRPTPALANLSDVRQLQEDCESISWADLCERQLSSGGCFQLQPGIPPAGCLLRGPTFAAPAQLQGAVQGVVTTCGTSGELRITGQIQMISLRLEAESMIFEDAQVEAWHEAPDLSIHLGGAFYSKGPFQLTRSNLTVNSTGAVNGGALAAGDLTLISSSLRVLNAAAAKSGGGFYGEGTLRLRQLSKILVENVSAQKGAGAGFFLDGDADISDSGLIDIKNARSAKNGGGFSAKLVQLTNHSTVSIQHATSAKLGGGFVAYDEVVIAEMSNVNISDAVAEQGGGFQVNQRLRVMSKSTLNLQNVKAGTNGGGLYALGDVDIAGGSTVNISNGQAVFGDGGGFQAGYELNVSNGSTLIILNATAGRFGGGFSTVGRVAMSNCTVTIKHATAAEKVGGGFFGMDEVVIAEMSNVSISDAVAAQGGGGFYADKRLQVTGKSTLNLQNVKAGQYGGGFLAPGEVDIGGSSTVNISNSQAVSEDGAGFDVEEGLKISNGSTLIILNATAGRFGGGFYAGNKVAISNSTVTIQYAAAAVAGGGFYAQGDVTFADASTFAMSDTSAGDGGGFWVHTVLTIDNGSMRVANSTAERTGTAGCVDGMVSLSSQSSLDIHQAKGDRNSSALVASCLQLQSDSNFVLEGIIGGHGVDLQNNRCSSLCTNMTFQVATGAALHATGGLSSGLLSVKTCSSEVVRLSGIHLQSWNSSLLTTRPSYVIVDNVSIHFEPVDKLQILAAQENFKINSLAISCPDCAQGVTLNATEDGILQVLSPLNLECSKTFTVSNGLTPRCECRDYQITSEHFRNTELVSLEDIFRTCRFCKRHFYFQDDICHPCEFYRAWSDGERGMCQRLPRERQERAVLFTGAAAMVILAFIVFEILEAPLVILDARSDLEDPSEVTTKRMFTVVVQGPITSLPKSISRLVHQRVRYRAKGTGLQWLDFDPQKPQAIKVCGMARKKLLLQDVQVPFDCASCRGSLRATETYYLFTMLFALVFLLAMLPTSIKVAVMSGNRFTNTIVTAVFYLALPMVVVATVLHWPVSSLIQLLYRRTPFSEALVHYQKQILCKPHAGPDATHPRNQGLLVLTLRALWKHFESFILERNMHFVVDNIVRPLTQSKGVSFVTLWGGRQVDYFVSHSWDTSFSHFVHSIRCHALSKEGPTSWIDAAYWICSFANNQWNIAAELADDPMDSAFAQALRGGIKGVAMVLDHEVRPLTRVWCLFEFLLSSREQLELVFTTDVGVLGNDGCTSFDITLEVGKKIESLQVAKCQASSEEDKRKIFEYIITTLGSLESMDGRIKHLMGEMLKKNLANVGSATESLLHRLGQT